MQEDLKKPSTNMTLAVVKILKKGVVMDIVEATEVIEQVILVRQLRDKIKALEKGDEGYKRMWQEGCSRKCPYCGE